MRRREFLGVLSGAAAAWPFAVRGLQPTAVHRVGFLSDESRSLGSTAAELIAKALDGLGYVQGRNIVFEGRYADGKNDLLAVQQLGWTDGRNVRIDYRYASGNPDTLRKRAAELVALESG